MLQRYTHLRAEDLARKLQRRHILEEWGSYATQQEKVLEEVRDLGFQRLDTNYKGC